MKIRVKMKQKVLVLVFSMICVFLAVPAFGQVLESDFEKGTQKWEARGGDVSIKSTNKDAASGKKSLRITGRRDFWQGAQLNVTKTLIPGKTYLFTVAVKLAEDEDADVIKMTMQRGDNQWEGVAAVNANAEQWSTFSGKFKPDGSDPYLLIYLEAARERTSFYVDDFKIEAVEPPKQSGILLRNDFQDKTAQNWFVRGENVQMFSAAVGEARSLKVGDRSEPWHGLVLDVSKMFYKGRKYVISVSAKLVEGEEADSLKLTVIQTAPDGKDTFVQVSALTEVTVEKWVRISGEYEATTEDNNLYLLVEAKGAKTSYYIDDFELKVP